MTKAQKRAAARRRYERVEAKRTKAEADRARFARLAAIVGTVVVVVGVLAILGTVLAKNKPTAAATPSAVATTKAGCALPPASMGTGARLTMPKTDGVRGKTFVARVTTNCGDIQFTLDGAKAPKAVASFEQLAKADYWLNSPCHRLTASPSLKVLQCGDPTGTGSGEPGYGFAVENAPADGTYPRGALAMARTDDPKTGNGGQFFIVYADSQLPTNSGGYTIFGTVTAGLDIVERIAAAGIVGGNATDGAPAAPISILRVAVTEKKA